MGSPISVVIAEIVMQKIKTEIFDNSPVNILFWRRYVDDIFAVIPEDGKQTLLNHINSINENI